MHNFSSMPVNGIYNDKNHDTAKCVIHKFYYILTFKIPYYDISSDKNAKCTMQYCIPILDFVYYNFNLQ